MARIGNWDVTLSKQAWFDVTAGDPPPGGVDYTAIGIQSTDIDLAPPGIPSAESQALPKVFQIVAAPGIASAESDAPAMVAVLVEPPGIASAAETAPATPAIVITPAAIASDEVQATAATETALVAPGIPSPAVEAPAAVASPPPPPTSTAAHGGWPATRAPRPTDNPQYQWAMPDGWQATDPWPSDEQFATRGDRPRWFEDDTSANDNGEPFAPSLPPNVHIIDRFGPMQALPEEEFLVAGAIEERPWKWMLIGAAAAGIGVLAFQAMNKKKSAPKSTKKKSAVRARAR